MAERFALLLYQLLIRQALFRESRKERHVAEAIAVNLKEMAALDVPIIALVIGEGVLRSSGVAVADRVLILENAYYSVISPEGCAAILERSCFFRCSMALKLDANELLKLGIVDVVLLANGGSTSKDEMANVIKSHSIQKLKR